MGVEYPAAQTTFTLTPKAPYDFELTAAFATHYRGQHGVEMFQNGVYRRLLDIEGRPCLSSVRSTGTIDSPLLEVELFAPALDEDLATRTRSQVAWILGIDEDLIPFYEMASNDPILAPLANKLQGLHIPHTASVFECFVLAVLGQQLTSQVVRRMHNQLIHTYGPSAEIRGDTYYVFPGPRAIVAAGEEGLRAIGLSARKTQYILDVAARVVLGELDLEGLQDCDDEQAVRVLTGIRGVGMWTAQWLLIRGLGRADGFPCGDLALERTLGMLVNDGKALRSDEAIEYSRRWSPFRSYATTYVFAAIRLDSIADSPKTGEVAL